MCKGERLYKNMFIYIIGGGYVVEFDIISYIYIYKNVQLSLHFHLLKIYKYRLWLSVVIVAVTLNVNILFMNDPLTLTLFFRISRTTLPSISALVARYTLRIFSTYSFSPPISPHRTHLPLPPPLSKQENARGISNCNLLARHGLLIEALFALAQ